MDQVIAFATLFLGLVSGPRDVELLVGDEVRAVELLVDGASAGRLETPPWRLRPDFGGLEPHHLVAIAFDGDERELARAEQWINLPRPEAEISIILDRDEGSGEVVARLAWQSLSEAAPERILASFDDEVLDTSDASSVRLPPHASDRLHLLHVEAEFPDGSSAQADLTFGGFYADRVNTQLTALPVEVDEGRSRRAQPLVERLRSTTGPVPVVAVETGPADVVVVRDRSAQRHFEAILRREHHRMGTSHTLSNRSTADRLRELLPLLDVRLAFLWPFIEPQEAGARFEVFPQSPWLGSTDGGFAWLLSQMRQPDYSDDEQRLADATAVAGMQAARRNRRRAVILVLGDAPRDASLAAPGEVRRFLQLLRVPLRVWRITAPGEEAMADAPSERWGRATDLSTLADLRGAVKELHDALDRQRILWVEGRHLPQSLALDPAVPGVRILGQADERPDSEGSPADDATRALSRR